MSIAVPAAIAIAAFAFPGGGAASGGQARCSTEVGCSDVSISGHAEPQPIKRGGTSELKITPKNDGPGTAYGIDVQVTVPKQLQILEVITYGARNGCTTEGTFVRCDFGDFIREQLGVVRIKVKGKKRGTYISQAQVYSTGVTDPNGGNNQVSMTIGVQKRR